MNYGKKSTADKQKELTSKKNQYAGKARITVLRIVILVIIIGIISIGVIAYGLIHSVIADAPAITTADVKPSGYTTFVVDQSGNEIERFVAANANRIWRGIDQIPDYTQNAFVAIEDERFYQHNGIDLQGIARVVFKSLTNGGDLNSGGASTITQQLIKNTIYPDFVNETTFKDKLERKIQEQYLAVQLEKTMDKSEILEDYLNTINLGQNTLGIQTASTRYFGKDVSELTLSESAVLAAITQNPTKYNPITHPDQNATRRSSVLSKMLEQNMITKDEYDEAMADDVYSRIQSTNESVTTSDSTYSYYIDELTQQVIQDLQDIKGYSYTQAYNALYSGGLTIVSCEDSTIQGIVDEEINNDSNYPSSVQYSLNYAATVTHKDGTQENLYTESMLAHMQSKYGSSYQLLFNNADEANAAVAEYKADVLQEGDTIVESSSVSPEPQASIVLMDQYTGEVKALSGGRGDKAGSLTLNRATNTTRQPGSCFKVLSTYAPALDAANYTLASTIVDEPFNYETGRPVNNWYSGYKGTVTVRKAIEQSMNVCAVKTLTAITPRLGYDYLLNFGFTTLVDNYVAADGKVYSDVAQPLALGGITKGITNLEITAAYATLANSGTYTKPRFYTKILDHDGNVLIDNTPETRQVVSDATAGLLTNAMIDVVTQGTGTRAKLDNMPVSVDLNDIGHSIFGSSATRLTIPARMGGYARTRPFEQAGIGHCASIMAVSAKEWNTEFTMPSDYTSSVYITGKIATSSCPPLQVLLDSNAPTTYCPGHGSSESSSGSGSSNKSNSSGTTDSGTGTTTNGGSNSGTTNNGTGTNSGGTNTDTGTGTDTGGTTGGGTTGGGTTTDGTDTGTGN